MKGREPRDDLRPLRGILASVAIGLAIWLLIIGAILLIRHLAH